jgi:Cytochrome oxidase complex assembly protein 1
MENTSGQGAAAVIPPELDRWNWGAFFLNWIWGIGNNSYIALLMFVPGVNFVMLFMLGFKGSKWAWRNKRWQDIEHFKRVQRKWAIAGVIAAIVMIGFGIATYFGVMSVLKGSEPYKLAVVQLQTSQRAIDALGTPIDTGNPSGSLDTSGPKGKADLSIPATGPKGKGTVYVDATRDLGTWKINRIELEIEGRPGRINLGGNAR